MDRSTVRARRARATSMAVLAIGIAACLALGAVLAVPLASASEPSQTGWWNQARPDVSTPAGPLPPPPSPDVPEDGLPVAALLGDPGRIAGVGIPVDAAPGATVTVATLTIDELDGGGNAGVADAEIVACPILEFWVGEPNQAFESLPELDCDLAVVGERSEDGTWTFDLATIAAAWLDAAGTLTPEGVALLPAEDVDGSFQVVYDETSAVIDLQTTGGDDLDDPFALDDGGFDDGSAADGGFADPGPVDGGGFDPGPISSGGGFDPPAIGSDLPDPGPVPEPDPEPTDDEAAAPTQELAQQAASRSPMGFGQLPGPVWLLFPLVLALAAATSYSLGPAGEPVAAAEGRSVTRALLARSRVEDPR